MRRLSTIPALLLTASALAGLAGCGIASDDGSDQIDQAKRIDPTDDENLGLLQVVLPTNLGNLDYQWSVSYRSTAVSAGTASRFTAGTGCIVVTSPYASPAQKCGIEVLKKQTTNDDLAALKVAYAATATGPLAVDFGPSPSLRVFRTQDPVAPATTGTEIAFAQAGSVPWNGAPVTPVITVPGDYRFSFGVGILDDVKKSVSGKSNLAFDITPADKRAHVKVKVPQRDFPDATWQCSGTNRNYLVQRNKVDVPGQGEPPGYDIRNNRSYYGPGEGIVANKGFVLNVDYDFKMFPFTTAEAPMHYDYVVNNQVFALDLTAGKVVTVPVDRIDVNDVTLTKETGEKYTVQGTWQLFTPGPNNSWVPFLVRDCAAGQAAFSAPTKTGVDVLPGNYRVVVSYTTAEGGKTQEYVISVP
jgi:hypothetical protein